MTGISEFASNRILDFLLGAVNPGIPNNFFLGVSTTPLGNNGSGATEPFFDSAYQRVALPNNKITFSSAGNRSVAIVSDFLFPMSSVAWGVVTHFLIFDAAVGGNVWFYGELQITRDVEIDTALWLEPNTNSFSLDICGGSSSDMAITTWAANRILDHIFGLSPLLTPPANYFMGVSTTPTNSEGQGATEPPFGGSGYTRLQLPNNKTTFAPAAGKMVTLNQEMRFPNSVVPWGIMTHFIITDAAVGGNVWWSGRLVNSRNVEVATTLALIPNGFRWILDSCVNVVDPT